MSSSAGGVGITNASQAQLTASGSVQYALIQNTSKTLDVAWSDNGVAPTTAGPFFLFSQQSMKHENPSRLLFIRTGGSDVTLAVGLYA